jgi:signal transduction histidine kinase
VSPRALAVALALVAGGLGLGTALDGPLPWVLGGLAAIIAASFLSWSEESRVRHLAEDVSAWLGDDGYRALPARGTGPWRQLGIALNALGAAYERRGRKLARERPWRRQLVDSLVSPALLFSSELRLQSANDAARSLLGIPIDAGDITVVKAVGSAALAGAVREVGFTGEAVVFDTEHGERSLRASVSKVGDEILLIVTDRTRERRVEDVRRNFVVNASHELKTPVTGIRTLTEAMKVTLDTGDLERVGTLLARLDHESDRLARLVYDLLDLRRLEERGPLERVPVDLAEVVRQVVVGLLDRAADREIEVSVDAPDRAYLAGVPSDIEVIVKNLIANALQYNHAGGRIEVTIRPLAGKHILTVRDTGIGIPQQDLVRVFERFYRVDTARSRDSGGTGLGLAIVRHAVEGHGGSIRVDSLLGEGTTFTVELPIEPR